VLAAAGDAVAPAGVALAGVEAAGPLAVAVAAGVAVAGATVAARSAVLAGDADAAGEFFAAGVPPPHAASTTMSAGSATTIRPRTRPPTGVRFTFDSDQNSSGPRGRHASPCRSNAPRGGGGFLRAAPAPICGTPAVGSDPDEALVRVTTHEGGPGPVSEPGRPRHVIEH